MATIAAPASGALHAFATDTSNSNGGALFEHEEEVARDPYSVNAWTSYLKGAADVLPPQKRYTIYERGIHVLPRSYKLWKAYLDEYYETQVRGKRVDALEYVQLVALYERALVQLNKMPRIWLDFLELLQEMKRVTFTRHAFDRALRALPITQHHRIWTPYLAFVKEIGLPQVAVRVYRRYLMLEPGNREEYLAYLCSIRQYEEASLQLVTLIDNQSVYPTKRTVHSLWMQLCDMITQHPEDVSPKLNVEAILRSGIAQFTDEVGRLWCSLATYFVRLGMFESARDIYEEGIRTVMTVRDFSMIFDAYVKFIEAMLTAEMELAENPEDDEDEEDDVDHQAQVDRLLKIYEDVADRRPILLNSVLLRQNPHNVREWEKRVELQKTDLQKVIRTYAEAVKTVDPAKAGGRLHTLWVKFAKFYEEHKDIANARVIFQKASDVEYRNEHELANVYCEWAEMELRQDNFEEPLDVLRGACAIPPSLTIRLRNKTSLMAKDKVHKSVKLWALRLDLEESLGDLNSTRTAYNEAFEQKIVTPQMVLNFAAYLEENKFFEESFRVYERGLSLFPSFPYANEIWQAYLTKFVKRYGGTKVERARDLHEQAIKAAPAKFAKALFVKYAEFEEKHGMLRNVMAIYDRATEKVPEEEQLDMYAAYVKKAQKFFGVSKVRDVYQRGIASLPDKSVAPLCLKFADMETKLGEIERARAIYTHASQFCDPRQHEASFWKVWHDFEVSHGSEHSFLEMLRIKRSVVAQYSQVNYISAEIAPVVSSEAPAGMVAASSSVTNGDAMAALEANLVDTTLEENGSKKRKLEAGDDGDMEEVRPLKQPIVQVANEEEIDLDDEDDEDDEEEAANDSSTVNDEIEERAVPEAVFGKSLAQARNHTRCWVQELIVGAAQAQLHGSVLLKSSSCSCVHESKADPDPALIMEIDPYKRLLSSASREHLKRQAELKDRFVGNVFLPAIHRPSQDPTAAGATSPLKHLKVIEQCIMAENKREEQLAKCQNDTEKRFWTRKFQTQRNYERKLIQALMLGPTIDAELEIADVNARDSPMTTLSHSPLQASVQRMTTGITAKVPNEDRMFYKAKVTGGVPNTKPHLRTKFNLPDCQGSPHKVKPYHPRPSKLMDTAPVYRKSLTCDHTTASNQPVAKKKTGNGSPPSHRQSRSATPLRVSPSNKPRATKSPSPVNLSPPRPSKSSLKQYPTGPTEAMRSGHSPKKKHVKPTTKTPGLRSSNVKIDTDDELLVEDESVLSLEGPTSFLEAQQIAITALKEKSSSPKGSAKSEKNVIDPGSGWAPHSAEDNGDDVHEESGTTSMRTKTNRPHSSPCSRAELRNVVISHSHSTAYVTATEFLKIADFEEPRRIQAAPAASFAKEQESMSTDEAADQTATESYDEFAEDATSTLLDTSTGGNEKTLTDQRASEQTDAAQETPQDVSVENDLHVEELGTDELEVSPQQQQQSDFVEAPADILPDDQMMSSSTNAEEEDLDENAEMEVAEVLFDLVDQLAGDDLVTIDASVAPESTGSTTNFLTASIHIQSAFRGHQARRAFRMALYQEALSCGVLGAMPGSFQGKSGWYQDPKSFMAYYFTIVADTGEWKQKLVIRCSRLILTSYEMHEEILSKVFISP